VLGGPRAVLDGGQQTFAVSTDARGFAGVRLGESVLEYTLSIDPMPLSAITIITMNVGEPGTDGQIVFFAYDPVTQGTFPGTYTGTMSAGQLIARPALGINTFADLVGAFLEGRVYFQVRTQANPDGELRGNLSSPVVGTTQVAPDGRWRFMGKSGASPGVAPRSVNVESLGGVRVLGLPLEVR
jgi:hypothetical protein